MATARRSPAPAAAPARRAAAPSRNAAPRGSSGYRGAAGLAMMAEEEKRAEARKEAQAQMSGAPFRFYCPVGETREVVVIDEAPDFFRYEHNLKNRATNKWDIFTACINDHANCPVCQGAERPPYFGMFLTIIDLTPYVNRDGIEVPWSKKLLVVKPQQQKKIMRIYQREGTLRGVVLAMTRDGEKDASIGNDIEVVEIMDEDALAEYVDEYTDKKNVVHEVIGNEVFDYDELFPEPTEESLRAIAGGSPEPGSRESDRRATRGGDDWNQDGGRAPVRRRPPAEAPEPAARGPVRRGAAPAGRRPAVVDDQQDGYDDPDQQGDDADAPDADPPARGPVRRAAPPARQAAPTRAAPTRAAPARRAPATEPEQDDAPQRGAATSLAQRRQQLRR